MGRPLTDTFTSAHKMGVDLGCAVHEGMGKGALTDNPEDQEEGDEAWCEEGY